MAVPRYRDPGASITERVDDLVSRMTLDEKVAQVGGVWLTSLVNGPRLDPAHVAATLPHGIGHVTRIGATTGLRPRARARLMNEIQRIVVERTRLGIPVVVHEESTGGSCARDATVFPQGIGLASTWDPELVESVAGVIRDQLFAVGARHTLAPVLDVARDPRWGRVEETYGEDPVLAGVMGTAYVRGVQTGDLREGVIATGKHFLAYGWADGGLNTGPAHVGPRELREVFAEPFAAAIRDAGLASIMNSYGSIDGLPCASSRAILEDLLRDELGFDGVVVSDYLSLLLLIFQHRVAATKEAAATAALAAGLDLELPAADCFAEPLAKEVTAGRVPLSLLDRAVGRVLASKFRLGLFEQPYVDADDAAGSFGTPAQAALARRAATESLVLLHNEAGVLPLGSTGRVAVIGPAADDARLLQGDYHYPAHVEIVYEAGPDPMAPPPAPPVAAGVGISLVEDDGDGSFDAGPFFTPHVTPLAGLRAALADAEVLHHRGCGVHASADDDVAGAAKLAASCDVAVVCVGGRSGLRPECTVGEARDATDLALTGRQEELVAAVAATGVPTVVVVVSGRVHTLEGVARAAGALVLAWLPGEAGGHALADVLLGRCDATGRLPVSLPRNVGQVPVHHGQRAGGGHSYFYGPYADSPTEPLFPFGHGMSYATFEHGPLEVGTGSTRAPSTCRVEVRNTSARAGTEVVQLYARDEVARVARPRSQLLGFRRVALEAGARTSVVFVVHPSRLAFYDEGMRFVVEPGAFRLWTGSASAPRSSATLDLPGDVAEYRQAAVVATRSFEEERP